MRIAKAFIVAVVSGLIMAVQCGCGNAGSRQTPAGGATEEKAAPARATYYTYTVKNTYPHDPTSYTQGLFWHDGCLWEGTGQYGMSALVKVDLETGKMKEKVDLDGSYFGEGIALLDGKVYQLTWQENTAFVYDASTIVQTGKFRYNGEGWGLTTDGTWLYMSDGSSRIYVVDPADFSRKRSIGVQLNGHNLMFLNELEWINGRIWANVYMDDAIVVIDPATGVVEAVVDMRGILPASEHTASTDVLNGIAYDPVSGRIFVTGKNWPKLYEIELVEKK